MLYIVSAAVAALGLWAAWLSGRDVGLRNAARRAEEDEDPTLMLKIEAKGEEEANKVATLAEKHESQKTL